MAHPSSSTSPPEGTYVSNIASGAHGERYQKDLAMVIFERATHKGYDFQLGYEMAIADKFDDVVFFNKIENKWTLVQVKHADTSNGRPQPLKFELLFPVHGNIRMKGDFSFFKYFKSYMTVQNNIKERKTVVIFTNRDLLEKSIEQSVEIEARTADEILHFDYGRHIGLKVKDESLVKEMVEYFNRDFTSLRDSIVKLFMEETMDQTIKDFKTPVASILTKTNSIVKFCQHPSSEACQMLTALSSLIDIKTAQLSLDKCNELFSGMSSNKTWPLTTNAETVHQFFRDLTLFVRQPDDFRDTIEQDLRSWMRTWIRPDYFQRLEEPQLKIASLNIDNFFDDKQVKDAKRCKKFLLLSDGEEFFARLKKDLEKQIYNLSNYNKNGTRKYYVNRQIELHDKKRLCDDEFVSELTIKFKNQRLLLLTAEPGMGKSTILEFIALNAQRRSSDQVYHIYLNKLNEELKKFVETETIDNVLSVLGKMLSEANMNDLQRVIQCNDSERNYFIVFDAFDEVFPQNRKTILKLFSHLLNIPSVKLLVSSRAAIEILVTDCEESFKVKSMRLVPLYNEDQIKFLRQYWQVPQCEESRFRAYVDHLFKVFHTDVNRALFEIIGLPLILKMLAEVYIDHFKEYLKSEQNYLENLNLLENFNTAHLYEQFVRKSFDTKLNKKSVYFFLDIDEEYDPLFRTFTLEHQLLAIKHLQIESLETVFKDEIFGKMFNEFEKRILNGTEKSPLVEVVDNTSRFIHLSIAEFLIAQFLLCNIAKYESVVFDVDSEVSFFYGYHMIRTFLFTMIEEQYNIKHLEMLEKHYQKNRRIVLWACEKNGQKTVEFLLRSIHDSTITEQLLCTASKHNCFNICTYLLKNHQVNVDCKIKEFDGATPLVIAAAYGHTEVVKLLITHHANINAQQDDGNTPLHVAAGQNETEVIKILLENSANLHATDNDGWTPLHLAVRLDCINAAKILIDHSADINAQCERGCNPLHVACFSGKESIAQMLINRKADINAKSNNGSTPLHLAAENNHEKLVKLLTANSDANVDAQEDYGRTPLHLAAEKGHFEIVKLLLDFSNVNVKDEEGWMPIHLATEKGFLEVVKILLDHSGGVNAETTEGWTSLHLAAQKGHLEIVNLLIEHSGNVNAKEIDGWTPLHLAAQEGHSEIVKLLIELSGNVNAKETEDWTPLHLAAQEGHSEVSKLLICHSANVNAVTNKRTTPLHLAAQNGHKDVVNILVDHFAEVNAQNEYSLTARDVATRQGHTEIIKILMDLENQTAVAND